MMWPIDKDSEVQVIVEKIGTAGSGYDGVLPTVRFAIAVFGNVVQPGLLQRAAGGTRQFDVVLAGVPPLSPLFRASLRQAA